MIQSMTGFGRATFEVEGVRFDVEARSVNHRYLDLRVRLPRQLSQFESVAKASVQGRLRRGRIDASVVFSESDAERMELRVDHELAGKYVSAARELAEAHGLSSGLEVDRVLALPGVTSFADLDFPEKLLSERLVGGLGAAIDGVVAMREVEGEALAREFESRLDRIVALIDAFEKRSGVVVDSVRAKLHRRIEQLGIEASQMDESRLHQEIALAADRMDITEELVRLRSHVDQFRAILSQPDSSEPCGRRLDFLLQEFGREANTVGSKASDAPLAQDVVELKAELERLREQVQNVE